MMDLFHSIKERIRDFFRTRRRNKLVSRAIDLAHKGKHSEAATIHEQIAVECIEESELLASLYYRYAFEHWLAAMDPKRALEQALNVLQMLIAKDGKWLTYDSGENVDDLIAMVSKLYAAGYLNEGETLAVESNKNLEKYGLPVRCSVGPVGRSKFPSLCSQCGGTLPVGSFERSVTCTFCQTVVYAT